MNEMRIYVASLSDYNNGRLEGKHFDLSDYSNASELMEAIQEMLDELNEKYNDGEVREEWAVHDYEGIPSTLASEYMSEQDFQQLYDIAEVADDKGIPVEVLIERAGDTGSDDYEALADSLMFVVDGYDTSDIVAEYESQIGELGSDFWSNHIFIDDVTERVIYGEDVDRFREDILYENSDMDEDEAERQAEEMADEEAERREDLTTYLEDMGYSDEIPSFVSKDYEGAWKRSLSYDFDVINHDGQMYVFTNNYSLGGTILSGMIGAYIGYKVGRAKPQKKGFSTEKRIGRNIKGALSKKKMAKGGGVSYIKNWEVIGINKFGKMFKEKITLGRMSDKEDVKNALRRRTDLNIREITSIKEVFAKGGNVNTGRSWHQDRRMHNKSESYEKPMSSRKSKFAGGGKAKGVEWMKSDGQYEAELGDLYLIISPATERGLYQVRVKKGYRGETIGVSQNEISGLDKAKDLAYDIAGDYYKQFGDGGGISGLNDLIRG
jgi:antirestriction protein